MIDLAEAPHGIIGGESGSGKSVFVRQFLTGLALLKSPQELQLTLIDLKHGVELADFESLPHVKGFAKDISEVDAVLSAVNRLIDERGHLFRQAGGIKSLAQYNEMFPDTALPYHAVIVDELAELEDTEAVERISRLGRAYGVHLLMATQRPDANTLSGPIKANCPLKVCFQVINGINSRIILDHERAKDLPPVPGRCIVQYRGERQAQALYLAEDRAQAIIAKEVVTNDRGTIERKGNRDTDRYF